MVLTESVDAPPLGERRVREALAIGVVSNVGLHDDRLAAGTGARRRDALGLADALAAIDDQARAAPREVHRRRLAHAARGAGDDVDLAVLRCVAHGRVPRVAAAARHTSNASAEVLRGT